MNRMPYEQNPTIRFVSTKNEPWYGYRQYKDYPDMYAAYELFARNYNLNPSNFILTNGCENAFRAAVLAVKGRLGNKPIALEHPGWGLTDVICTAFDIPFTHFDYHYNKKKGFYADPVKASAAYLTDRYNNLFEHAPVEHRNGITILDETYTMNILTDVTKRNIKDNVIIIGSFSKIYGPGLRLGYVLFSDKWIEKMQLLREQYINQAAVDFICAGIIDRTEEMRLYQAMVPNLDIPIVSSHPTYLTLDTKTLRVPHKGFEVDGHPFCRVGRLDNVELETELFQK